MIAFCLIPREEGLLRNVPFMSFRSVIMSREATNSGDLSSGRLLDHQSQDVRIGRLLLSSCIP